MPVWCKTHPTVQHHIDIKFVGRRLHRGGMGWWGAMDPSPWQPGPGEGSALGADMEDFTGVAMSGDARHPGGGRAGDIQTSLSLVLAT